MDGIGLKSLYRRHSFETNLTFLCLNEKNYMQIELSLGGIQKLC